MKALLLAGALLGACAPTPQRLNTTAWALMQDAAFAADTAPAAATLQAFDDLDKLQTSITPTNLTIRQRLLWAARDHAAGIDVGNRDAARAQFMAMASSTAYWPEGPDYFGYVRDPLLWYTRVTGDTAVPRAITDSIMARYRRLAAPDGTLPVPEASEGWSLPPSNGVDTREYHVRRWPAGGYILIARSSAHAPALNLHHHLETGYFALHDGRRWIVRCRPYTGWSTSNPDTEDGFYDLLPRRAVRPNVWRVKPPRIQTQESPGRFVFEWPRARREIQLTADSVIVNDSWGWFGSSRRAWGMQ